MTSSEKYHYVDFTLANYSRLVGLAKKYFNFCFFDGFTHRKKFILWRHDVDYSLNYAVEMAKIEKKHGVKSTFFIWIHSGFYNALDESARIRINEIMRMGHQIGIHLDASYYKIHSAKQLNKCLTFEKDLFRKIFGVNIKVFSFHNPDRITRLFSQYYYSGIINTYARIFRENIPYCSDSNGYWRFERLEDFLQREDTGCAQVLTHPEWWQEKKKSPRKRILKVISDRSRETLKHYDDLLFKFNRKNIDG